MFEVVGARKVWCGGDIRGTGSGTGNGAGWDDARGRRSAGAALIDAAGAVIAADDMLLVFLRGRIHRL